VNPEVIRRLLKQKPFKRFVLCLATDYEYEVDNIEHWRLLADDVIARSAEGITDLIDLKLVERIRIEDGFTFEELDRLMK
jgi:hypothetical protein